jgi:hypothetical protein
LGGKVGGKRGALPQLKVLRLGSNDFLSARSLGEVKSWDYLLVFLSLTPKGNMTSKTPSSVAERRLAIARRLFQALVVQDPDRSITLCDSSGEVVAQHRPEVDAPKIAEL